MTPDIETFLQDVEHEYARARAKFPDSICCLAALMEEVGELADALLEMQFAIKKAGSVDRATMLHGMTLLAAVRKEAVQVAVMAARVALEGDASLDAIQSSASVFPSKPRA